MADAYVQLPPDGAGKKVDTFELQVGGSTVERQRVLVSDPVPAGPHRAAGGRLLFVEDFADGFAGMYNDGCGSASIDHNIRFNGRPSVRLDPQGNSSTSSATGGNQSLTLAGSAATYTPTSNGTLVGTTTQAGAPAIKTGGVNYIVLNTPAAAGQWPTVSGNSCVLTYTGAVTTGGAGNWTVTFTGVNLLALPGAPEVSVTTANQGTATMAACNPNPNCTGSPLTSGVVFKRRVCDQFSGRFGHSFWFRPTGKSAATSFTSVFTGSLYNRDGVNLWAARCLIQTAVGMNPPGGVWNNDNQILWYITGVSAGFVLVPFAFLTRAAFNQHSWDPVGGTWDRAGGWHYLKLIADFAVTQYVSIQFDEAVYTSMAGQPLYQGIGDTGAKMMHFSVELAMAQSPTRRFWNVAKVTGTQEQ